MKPGKRIRMAYGNLFGSSRASRSLLNGILVLTILVVAVSVGYSSGLGSESGLTEFYLLPDDTDGELSPADYSVSLERGTQTPYTIGVRNLEGETVDYTVVAVLQETAGENDTSVVRESELYREEITIADNRERELTHGIEPPFTGERLRLVYYLYTGSGPADPSSREPYQELHLWVNVSAPET